MHGNQGRIFGIFFVLQPIKTDFENIGIIDSKQLFLGTFLALDTLFYELFNIIHI